MAAALAVEAAAKFCQILKPGAYIADTDVRRVFVGRMPPSWAVLMGKCDSLPTAACMLMLPSGLAVFLAEDRIRPFVWRIACYIHIKKLAIDRVCRGMAHCESDVVLFMETVNQRDAATSCSFVYKRCLHGHHMHASVTLTQM